MNTNSIATLLKSELVSRFITISNDVNVDVFEQIIEDIGNINNSDAYSDNYFYNYVVPNYGNYMIAYKDKIFSYLEYVKGRPNQYENFLSLYTDYFYADNVSEKTKDFVIMNTFVDYYLQKSIKEKQFNADTIYRCLCFHLDLYTKKDLNAFKMMAVRELERIHTQEELFNVKVNIPNMKVYEVKITMPKVYDLDSDLRDTENVFSVNYPDTPNRYQEVSKTVSTYTFYAQSVLEKDVLTKNYKQYFNDSNDSTVQIKEVFPTTSISKQTFEDLVNYIYCMRRDFEAEYPDIKGVNKLTEKSLKDAVSVVREIFTAKKEDKEDFFDEDADEDKFFDIAHEFKTFTLKVTLSKSIVAYDLYEILQDTPTLFVSLGKITETKTDQGFEYTMRVQAYEPLKEVEKTINKYCKEAFPKSMISVEVEF